MPLTMHERKAVTNELKERYRKATKKQRGAILDEFCAITGYNRSYASRKLRQDKQTRTYKKHKKALQRTRGRKRKYGPECLEPLIMVWAVLDFACGRRIAAGMADVIDALKRVGKWDFAGDVTDKLYAMSAATIDRLLKVQRMKLNLKGRNTTKPGSLLKSKIAIRTGTDWDEDVAGYVEMDTVAHCGQSTRGQYVVSLDVTDIKTCWSEQRAALNKAEKHVFAEVKEVRSRLPFKLLGIDTDCGGEFINAHMLRYCKANNITFTRGRPYKKNDGCHIEQKNWSIIRQTIGYVRLETQKECDLLNMVYDNLRLLTNFFMPSQKLIAKHRDGGRIIRKLDSPKTPYRRILESEDINQKTKDLLTRVFLTLDPLMLKREVTRLVEELYALAKKREEGALG
jgi:hypothetical protein